MAPADAGRRCGGGYRGVEGGTGVVKGVQGANGWFGRKGGWVVQGGYVKVEGGYGTKVQLYPGLGIAQLQLKGDFKAKQCLPGVRTPSSYSRRYRYRAGMLAKNFLQCKEGKTISGQ